MKKILTPINFIINHPLTKNQVISGLYRFISWQLKSRISNKILKIKWINNIHLLASKGMHGATGCIYVGLPEFEDMSFLLHYLREDDLFIDIGSNIGVFSLLAAGVNNTTSIAVEPIPSTFSSLTNNIEVNNLNSKISALNIGLSKEKSQLFFTNDGDTTNHVVEKESDKTSSVNVDTLDNIISDKILVSTLIKIDVEGFEYNVLKGAKNTLSNTNLDAVIIELNGCSNRFGFSDEMVDKELTSFGFEKFDYNPFNRELTPLTKFHTEGNTLYIRKSNIDTVKEKIKSAKSFEIFKQSI